MKRAAITKALRSNTKAVSVFICIVAILTCVSITFAWFGSTFENLNTVIAMGDYSANITVYDTDGSLIKNMSASNGEKVSFDNTKKLSGWSSGDVAAYYISAENTGEIDIKTYFSFKSSFTSKAGNSIDDNKKHFSFLIKNITQSVKSDDINGYINNSSLPTAQYIYENGKTFAETDSSIAGRVNSGEKELFALYFCCYDLPDEYVNSKYSFVLNTSIVTTQAGMPEDEAATTQPQTDSSSDPTANTSDSDSDSTLQTGKEQSTASPTNSTDGDSQTESATQKPEQTTEASKAATKDEWVWRYNDSDKKTATITEYNGKADKVIIPVLAGGAVVTGLGDNLFADSSVTGVTVPATINVFNVNTFTCSTLKSLTIQEKTNVSDKIYMSPFVCKDGAVYTSDMTSLVRYLPQTDEKEFVVPASVQSIFDNAFSGCNKLETLSVKNVSSFNANTLSGSAIKDVNLYNDAAVNAAGFEVFGDSSKVVIHIPSTMKDEYSSAPAVRGYEVKADLESDVYENYPVIECNGLKYMVLNNGDEYKGTKYEPEGYSEFVIVTDYNEIPENGVVIIPETVVCNEKVYTVAAVADGAFRGCSELKEVILPSRSVIYTSKAFEGCDNLGLVQYNDVLPYTPGIKETAALNDPESSDDESSEDSE